MEIMSIFHQNTPKYHGVQLNLILLVNDLVDEIKGINVDWLIKENVRSYASYPLEGKDRVIGVLEIFNDKVFSPREFELVQSLSVQVSSELSKLY